MKNYGVFAKTKDGRKRLCANTEAETIGKASDILAKWADAMLGEGAWWVEQINEGGLYLFDQVKEVSK